ncbi:haloacid dehalogenase superfamily, subfamily IA, variant 1 with third motif having Dx(3-4)D or Dx(3-4)E [Streptomyces sp. 3213]|uniref:HAD family hydrolase n=1 Tax=Streptomyces sp. 3213.3 TaxID=1855348 RepID=UPI0008944072|nr:HAD-IA family hydrolase [Streptomyces sp. 3213.3]SEE26754.1 haloacid dehalogenase superfamily, subfamily IA, variant 1 with third motif having Dx(3-4)D or Dx(3-4)E [Streptomyces sp. 3213] [Streptomyces sp. 3213.3]
MTPDTPAAEPDTASADDLRKLISSVRYVLWDLDGPICRLFAGHSAATIASELVSLLGPDEQFKLLPTKERLTKDPHGMLVSISRRHPDTEQIVKLEEWLTRQELKAVGSAVETPHAKDVIQAWADSGVRLAVSTNNSARAAAAYLAAKGLDRFFAHVYGRTRDLRLMKPDPHSLTLALEAMGADPSEALMLGDAPTDYVAAQAADVPFLGYAHDLLKVRAFLQARVEPSRIVRSLEEVWDVLR